MARDPLAVLLRLREIALDTARRALAERLREEAAATGQAAALKDAVVRETALLSDSPLQARVIGDYGAWRIRMLRAQQAAWDAVHAAAAATAEAQATLNAARADSRVVEAAMAQMADQRLRTAAAGEQRRLDEVASWGRREETVERVTGIEPA